MEENWLKDIHNRMADFEVDEPQGLWDGICAAEGTSVCPPVASKRKNRSVWMWYGTAAACLLLLGIILPFMNTGNSDSDLVSIQTANNNHEIPTNIMTHVTQETRLAANHIKTNIHTTEVRPDAATGHESQVVADTIAHHTQERTKTVVASNDSRQTITHTDKRKEPVTYSDRQIAAIKTSGKSSRFAISLMMSGGNGTENHRLFNAGNASASSVLGESDWVDSPLLGIMTMNRGAETERKVTYHSPIRTGISFSYRLNDRWSIETGLSYALTSTEIREGSTANYVKEEQKIHYVGIPVGVSYRILSWKHFDVYLSSNMQVEQCVYGLSQKWFYLSNKVQGNEEHTITSRPMQWSVGAKAGLQYNLNSMFSVYAEPGCIYYFNDQSSLETAFKERPCDFNLNLGVRWSVGK